MGPSPAQGRFFYQFLSTVLSFVSAGKISPQRGFNFYYFFNTDGIKQSFYTGVWENTEAPLTSSLCSTLAHILYWSMSQLIMPMSHVVVHVPSHRPSPILMSIKVKTSISGSSHLFSVKVEIKTGELRYVNPGFFLGDSQVSQRAPSCQGTSWCYSVC